MKRKILVIATLTIATVGFINPSFAAKNTEAQTTNQEATATSNEAPVVTKNQKDVELMEKNLENTMHEIKLLRHNSPALGSIESQTIAVSNRIGELNIQLEQLFGETVHTLNILLAEIKNRKSADEIKNNLANLKMKLTDENDYIEDMKYDVQNTLDFVANLMAQSTTSSEAGAFKQLVKFQEDLIKKVNFLDDLSAKVKEARESLK